MPLTCFDHTYACSLEDFADWRKGRLRYSAWVIRTDAAVEQRITQAHQHLTKWLHPRGERQGHITVFVCGFVSPARVHDDDFTHQQRDAQIQALNALNLKAFELKIGKLNSFSTTAFLEVIDPSGQLAMIRNALAHDAHEVRQGPFAPHVTVGLYRKQLPYQVLKPALEALVLPTLTLPVKALEWVSFDACDPQGALTVESSFQLS